MLLCKSEEELFNVFSETKWTSQEKGLLLITIRTKIVVVAKIGELLVICLLGANIALVDGFVYLGLTFL